MREKKLGKLSLLLISACYAMTVWAADSAAKEETVALPAETAITVKQIPPISFSEPVAIQKSTTTTVVTPSVQ